MKQIIPVFVACFVLLGCNMQFTQRFEQRFERPPFSYDEWIDSTLYDKGIVPIFGTITDDLARTVIAEMCALEEREDLERITLLINSKGGSASGYLPIRNYIVSCKKPVDTINAGWCMSAAVPIHQVATGVRMAYRKSFFGYHAIQFHFNGPKSNYTDFINSAKKFYNDDIKRKANLPDEWFPFTDKAIVIDAKRAKELNVIDQIIDE